MRRFLPLAIALPAALAVGLSVAARAQGGRDTARPVSPTDAGRPVRLYEGTSNRGNIQEALDNAVNQAQLGQPGADRLIRYRLRDLAGEQGGIAGVNRLTVTIEVEGEGRRVTPPVRPAPTRPDQEDPNEALATLKPTLRLVRPRIDRADTAEFEFTLENPGDEPIRIPLSSSQRFEFEVRRGDRVVWRWSNGRFFTQALSALTLAPGKSALFKESWNLRNATGQRVPPGDYTVRAWVPTSAQGIKLEDTATLTITGP